MNLNTVLKTLKQNAFHST